MAKAPAPLTRTIESQVMADLEKKFVLLGGPRQCGKTTLSRKLFPRNQQYLNYDAVEDRILIAKKNWDRSKDLIVFDELHKMKKWKSWLKGVYDKEGNRPRLLVTGSARLDILKNVGDSLAGRHFYLRLYPLGLAELKKAKFPGTSAEHLKRLLEVGGFPEPFIEGSIEYANRWRRSHLDTILRDDLRDLASIRDIKSVETLVHLLSERVGSTISYASLARDLSVAPKTVQRWVEILERLYVVFVVTPFSKNIAKAISKEPKIYFFDTGRVIDEPGARFENLVANALLKRNHFLEDTQGEHCALHYVRDRNGREVDFLTLKNRKPEWLIEVKNSDPVPTKSLYLMRDQIQPAKSFQLVKDSVPLSNDRGIETIWAARWLAELEG